MTAVGCPDRDAPGNHRPTDDVRHVSIIEASDNGESACQARLDLQEEPRRRRIVRAASIRHAGQSERIHDSDGTSQQDRSRITRSCTGRICSSEDGGTSRRNIIFTQGTATMYIVQQPQCTVPNPHRNARAATGSSTHPRLRRPPHARLLRRGQSAGPSLRAQLAAGSAEPRERPPEKRSRHEECGGQRRRLARAGGT
ncbi:hypothetical protein OH76DRAFT_552337 [Lentinus brumalis]|uniref:Uncharacterized protein n=1 Tax=Lentinus brumalis TaxID=2498619 RepID=A0A371CHH4_9APHY|nr:hypothetical protein OH76DRAFT_552337 [Polyporus brumalis]